MKTYVPELNFKPIILEDWWANHCKYSKFERQGLDIICAEFHHPSPKANVIFLTGWNETFLKYAELIRSLYDSKFSVFTYDHQSQGLSGRWLPEPQSTWIHTFDDYVDDFVSFSNMISKEHPHLPMYLVAHSMGGLVAAIAMAKHPAMINRAVLCAPMLRNKCGIKALNYEHIILPQLIVYALSICVSKAGLGTLHALGFFKENPSDPIPLKLTTDSEQIRLFEKLRQRYPKVICCCPTNDWVLHSLQAQMDFAKSYELVRTNCLILQAEEDVFVFNRAMAMFVKRAKACRMFVLPESYHELLLETKVKRHAVVHTVLRFFSQKSDDVHCVSALEPLKPYDENAPIFSVYEMILRCVGATVGIAGTIVGLALIVGGKRRR